MKDSSSPTSTARSPGSDAGASVLDGAQRSAYFAEFAAAGELERRRVAESIHDDPIQVIAAMGMRLQMLRRSISDPAQLALLGEAERAVQHSIARLRHLVFELHPPGLEQEGLAVALAIALDTGEPDATTHYRLDDRLQGQPAAAESAILFRIAQEALANVRAHADASHATVTLLERDGGHAVRIADDGCGCDPALAAPGSVGYGFASMRARAQLGGGSLSVDSVTGEGTTVEAWLPG